VNPWLHYGYSSEYNSTASELGHAYHRSRSFSSTGEKFWPDGLPRHYEYCAVSLQELVKPQIKKLTNN